MQPDLQAVRPEDQRTIGEAIRLHAAIHPEYPAIVASGFRVLSYRELQDQIDKIGAGLHHAGFDRNARIVVALENSPQAALAIVAVACFAVAVPIDPKLTVPEVKKHFASVRPNGVLLQKNSNSVARSVAELQGLTVIEATVPNEGELGLQLFSPRVGAAVRPNYPDPNDLAFILRTSGTLADPKLIPSTHRRMLAAVARQQVWYEFTPRDRCLCVIPVAYTHGLVMTVLLPLLTGGSIAFPVNQLRVDLAEWLGSLRPTWFTAGPTLLLAVFEHARSQLGVKSMHSLRLIISSGASLPQRVYEGLQSMLGVPLLEQYGTSETTAISTNRLPPGSSRPGTCGIPWPNTVAIVGDDGKRLLPGEQGEVLVSGPTVISGYLDASEINHASFVDGWFRTGDRGSLDEEGFLSLHGRVKEFINRGTEKISPLEIDNALIGHPAVAEAAAFAVPHPRLGEDVAAAIVLHPGMNVNPIELRNYLAERLSWSKVPRRITIVDQLPKGTTGKVLRRQLSGSLSAHRNSQAL